MGLRVRKLGFAVWFQCLIPEKGLGALQVVPANNSSLADPRKNAEIWVVFSSPAPQAGGVTLLEMAALSLGRTMLMGMV